MTLVSSPVDDLAERFFTATLERDPLTASVIGRHEYDGRLPDLSPEAAAADRRTFQALRSEAEELSPDPGEPEEALTLSAIRSVADAELAWLEADPTSYTLDVTWGLQSSLLSMASYQPLRSPADGEAALSRWRSIAPTVDQQVANLRRGLAEGRTPIRDSAEKVAGQLREALAAAPEEDALLIPIRERPVEGWADEAWRRFATELQRVVADEARPALARLLDFVEREALPHGRSGEEAGLGSLPDGGELYARLVRAETTTTLTPEAIHATGLAEVERIDAEMAELGRRILGTGSLAETQAALRSDPRMHFETAEQVVEVAERSLARANEAVPAWFGRVPRTPCVVTPMLPHEEQHTTIAYYREPAADGSRPGRYYINTWQPQTRPRYEAEALAFHEAVPGHHLQIALAQELPALPDFRRHANLTGFIEGWGLYTERLGDEMGLYSGDLDRLGMLSFDAWRACRLVVDTGMHAMGWSRARAIGFMLEHSALAQNNIVNEVDRYLGRPAQALAYKVGQLTISRLRREAEERLGTAFDVRAFHDAVLGHGPLPLDTLAVAVESSLP
jgi:uncharacterized protein (DUF885 family)